MNLDWRDDALCRETDPDDVVWFPARGESGRTAKRICGLCTVRAECLADALTYPVSEDSGVRGGLSERERKKLRREAAQPLAPVIPITGPSVPDQPRRAA